ncbi:MAG: exosortase A [Pedobacter sp.]
MTVAEYGRTYRVYLIGVVLLLSGLYWKIFPSMVQDWYKDENYSHGFIVPLIAGYFLYTRWDELKKTPVIPWNAGLAVILLGLLQLLVGWLGTEFFSMRSSLIVILAGLVLYLFGTYVFRIALLSLAFLIFMIPIPYIIYDAVAFPLKIFVTKVSVLTLQMLGIVVIREGNIIMFPALTLEVADACSGIRSLISLLALAVALAFFLKISPFKRLVMICAAVPIAIFSNAVRVIVTGVLAQYWGAKAAEGFFHEFAGMVVFAMAMAMLVSLGTLLGRGKKQISDIAPETPGNDQQLTGMELQASDLRQGAEAGGRKSMVVKFVSVFVLLTTVALYLNLHKDLEVPMNKTFDQFPKVVSGWRMTQEFAMADNIQKVLRATDTLTRRYEAADGKLVDLYIGYHGGGKDSGEIHSPKHCLPGSGWFEVSTKRRLLDVSGSKINLVQAVYRKGDNRQMFLYWFQVQDKTISDEYSLKIAEIVNSIINRRRDASFIRISVPFESDEQGAVAIGERFIRDLLPTMHEFLPE